MRQQILHDTIRGLKRKYRKYGKKSDLIKLVTLERLKIWGDFGDKKEAVKQILGEEQ